MNEESLEHRVEIVVGEDQEAGVFAGFASVWRTQEAFVLDFAIETRLSERLEDTATGEEYVQIPARVVSRIRIPPAQVWELMKALEQNLSAYERDYGPLNRD
ncbi:DUF3467 domain-containing protein [Actinocorallia longicatena]|uniref:DUF3467 domain-containing protein n=1 Tax=Actinocorallia longicatena TaxID=111803 RepID=A0ABP6Q3S0_9ACTN